MTTDPTTEPPLGILLRTDGSADTVRARNRARAWIPGLLPTGGRGPAVTSDGALGTTKPMTKVD